MTSNTIPVGVLICPSSHRDFLFELASEFAISDHLEFMKKQDELYCYVFDHLEFCFLRFNLVKCHIPCRWKEAEGESAVLQN